MARDIHHAVMLVEGQIAGLERTELDLEQTIRQRFARNAADATLDGLVDEHDACQELREQFEELLRRARR